MPKPLPRASTTLRRIHLITPPSNFVWIKTPQAYARETKFPELSYTNRLLFCSFCFHILGLPLHLCAGLVGASIRTSASFLLGADVLNPFEKTLEAYPRFERITVWHATCLQNKLNFQIVDFLGKSISQVTMINANSFIYVVFLMKAPYRCVESLRLIKRLRKSWLWPASTFQGHFLRSACSTDTLTLPIYLAPQVLCTIYLVLASHKKRRVTTTPRFTFPHFPSLAFVPFPSASSCNWRACKGVPFADLFCAIF